MNSWVLKQLRALVLTDLKGYIPENYFDENPELLKFNDSFASSEYLSFELRWGQLAAELGRKLYFRPPASLSARQMSACELLMMLGLLAVAESMLSAAGQLSSKAAANNVPDCNAGNMTSQLKRFHVPTLKNNVSGAFEQYMHHLTHEEAKPYISLLKDSEQSEFKFMSQNNSKNISNTVNVSGSMNGTNQSEVVNTHAKNYSTLHSQNLNLDRLKSLLSEGQEKMSNPISWRNDSSFSRWKDKVSRSLKLLLGDNHDEVNNWERRLFGPPIIFSTTDQNTKDDIFCRAVKSAVNQLENVVEEFEYLSSKAGKVSVSGDQIVNLSSHFFQVALSFPGEVRDYVESTASSLIDELGKNAVFYDNNFKSQLARPSLDVLLQQIYGQRSRLLVVFLCEKYQEKNWCGVEFRAIRNVLFRGEIEKVMYVKMDDGQVDGVFTTDGYIDGRRHSPEELSKFVLERLQTLP